MSYLAKSKLSLHSIGMSLMFLYIFMAYNACDLIIPSLWCSFFLYLFLAFGSFVEFICIITTPVSIPFHTFWYLTFMYLSLFTMSYSQEQRIFSGTFYLMIVTLILTIMFRVFIRDENSFRLLCWFHAISCFTLIATLFFTGNLTGDANNRLGGSLMGNANTFATMIMIAVLYELWLIIYGGSSILAKLLLIFMLIANLYTLALSAGRKYFIIPFVFLYAILFFRKDKNGRQHLFKKTLLIIGLVSVAYILIMNVPVLYNSIGIRIEFMINGIKGVGLRDNSSVIREKLRELAIKEWSSKPLLGHGFDSFKYYAQSAIGSFFYSHCNYTELLYNGGIIYFVAYYWIYYKIFKDIFILKKGKEKHKAFAFAVMISFLLFDYAQVSYSLTVVQIMIAVALKSLELTSTKASFKNATDPETGKL